MSQAARTKWINSVRPIAMKVDCPLCGAAAGKPCALKKPIRSRRGHMRSVALGPHMERLRLARIETQPRSTTT